jgi:hypothetical protein
VEVEVEVRSETVRASSASSVSWPGIACRLGHLGDDH